MLGPRPRTWVGGLIWHMPWANQPGLNLSLLHANTEHVRETSGEGRKQARGAVRDRLAALRAAGADGRKNKIAYYGRFIVPVMEIIKQHLFKYRQTYQLK